MACQSVERHINYTVAKKTGRGVIGTPLTERSHSEEAACCRVFAVGYSGKGKTMEAVKRPEIVWDPGKEEI